MSLVFKKTGKTVAPPYFVFTALERFPEIRHAIFTRKKNPGDTSFQGFNTSLSGGNDPERAKTNRRIIQNTMKMDRIYYPRQTHGTKVLILDKNRMTQKDIENLSPEEADAVVTDIPGLLLGIQTADCQPVLIYDPAKKVAANIHSGWKGSVANIIGKTVSRISAHFHCNPEDLVACVGPSLGPCCAEFINYKSEIPQQFWSFKNVTDHFNFWSITQNQLFQSGLNPQNIHIGGICTKCRNDLFFSYRKQKETGRFSSVIGILDNTTPTGDNK